MIYETVAVTFCCHKLDLVAHKFLFLQKSLAEKAHLPVLLPLYFPKGAVPVHGYPPFLVELSMGSCNELCYILIYCEI